MADDFFYGISYNKLNEKQTASFHLILLIEGFIMIKKNYLLDCLLSQLNQKIEECASQEEVSKTIQCLEVIEDYFLARTSAYGSYPLRKLPKEEKETCSIC